MDWIRDLKPPSPGQYVLRRNLGVASYADQSLVNLPKQPHQTNQYDQPIQLPTPVIIVELVDNPKKRKHNSVTIIFFGPPGAGKSVAGAYLRNKHGYFFYDADMDRPADEKAQVARGIPSTVEVRDRRFAHLVEKIRELKQENEKLAVSTWLPPRYHVLFKESFPDATFVLIEVSLSVREERIQNRTTHFISKDYAIQLTRTWGEPLIDHMTIINDGNIEDLHLKLDHLIGELLRS